MSITQTADGTIIATGDGINRFQAIVLKNALKMYRVHGMKVNRAYTPTAMLATAGRITGKTYKRGQFEQAENDLAALLEGEG